MVGTVTWFAVVEELTQLQTGADHSGRHRFLEATKALYIR